MDNKQTAPHGLRYVDPATFREMVLSKASTDEVAVVKYFLNDELDTKDSNQTRRIPFVISTDQVDRDRDTIAVDGWNLANYKKNPVVLWAHDYRTPPIAIAHNTKADGSKLLSTAEFYPSHISAFADSIFQMVQFGGLRAASVGFRPLEHAYNEDRRGIDIKKQELLEWSVVPIPANPGALVQLAPKSCLKFIGDWCEQYLDETYGTKGVWVPRFQVEEVFKFMNAAKTLPVQLTIQKDGAMATATGACAHDGGCGHEAGYSSDTGKGAESTGEKAVADKTPADKVKDLPDMFLDIDGDDIALELDDAKAEAQVLELSDPVVFTDRQQIEAAVRRFIDETITDTINQAVREQIDYARGRVT